MNSGWRREGWAWFVRSSRSWGWLVPSVLGLLEAREKKVREEVARLQQEAERVRAALVEAESRLARLADARVTVAEVLAEPPAVVAEPVASAVTGSVVPRRAEGMTASVLPPDYQRIMSVLESEADCQWPCSSGSVASSVILVMLIYLGRDHARCLSLTSSPPCSRTSCVCTSSSFES